MSINNVLEHSHAVYLHIVYGCFCTTTADSRSCTKQKTPAMCSFTLKFANPRHTTTYESLTAALGDTEPGLFLDPPPSSPQQSKRLNVSVSPHTQKKRCRNSHLLRSPSFTGEGCFLDFTLTHCCSHSSVSYCNDE